MPSKVDLQLETGEYFLGAGQRRLAKLRARQVSFPLLGPTPLSSASLFACGFLLLPRVVDLLVLDPEKIDHLLSKSDVFM